MNQVMICPVCKSLLSGFEHVFRCKDGHSFDVAKEGYLNLLLAQQKNSKSPGDSKDMVQSRSKFLNASYYKPLSDAINRMVEVVLSQNNMDKANVLDAGCGVGYYTDALSRHNKVPMNTSFYGIDVSKEAIRMAAKRHSQALFAVASIFDMPVKTDSIDVLMNIFSPLSEEEYSRVMKDNGTLIVVSPGANHLFELKQQLYDKPYLNDENKALLKAFQPDERIKVKYDLHINVNDDIQYLIQMTPYYWNTDKQKITDLLERESGLSTCVEFIMTRYSLSGNLSKRQW